MSPRKERSILKRNQPSSPISPASTHDSKKPRRSQRLHDKDKVDEEPFTPTKFSPTKKSNAKSPARARAATPTSSPAPLEATQVASQFHAPTEDEPTLELDPNTWGFLTSLNGLEGQPKTYYLKKETARPSQSSQHITRKKNSKKPRTSGFIIGRHSEVDLVIPNTIVSNRHCVIYKETIGGKIQAILEDLSSNGTWVSGVVVGRHNRRTLQNGDEIEIAGQFQYLFRYPTGMVTSKFHDTYKLGKPLGSGHFATVYLAIQRSTGNSFAVKHFKTNASDKKSKSTSLQQEISVLMSVSHPSLLSLEGSYEENDGVFLVLELAPEGELFNLIINEKFLSEETTRKIFLQLFDGMKYLHDRNIVHRDIKPENILLLDKNLTVKIADFGLAKIIGEESFTTSLCGTPSYVAPEVLKHEDRRYSRAVDVWSLGVVLYICLCGFPPFSQELCTPQNPYSQEEQIKRGMYEFPSPYWDHVTDPPLDLIERMLMVNPERRITVRDALQHSWVKNLPFNPADSCSSITAAISNLDFVRRKVKQERTLIAYAVGGSPTVTPKGKVEVIQENFPTLETNGSKQDEVREGISVPVVSNAEIKAFIAMGGKGAADRLFDGSYYEEQE